MRGGNRFTHVNVLRKISFQFNFRARSVKYSQLAEDKFGSTLWFSSPAACDSVASYRSTVNFSVDIISLYCDVRGRRMLSLRLYGGVCHGLTNPLSLVSGTEWSLMPAAVGRVLRVFCEIGGDLGSAFFGRNCVIRKHLNERNSVS